MKISIGVLTASALLHRKFVQSIMSLIYPSGVESNINILEGYQIPFARNRAVKNALKNNSDYLFFIDSDMVFPSDTLKRLLAHNVDIVNVLAFRRIEPHYPCIFDWNEENKCYITSDYSKKPGGLMKVDACGMPCILIKMDVFKKMSEPWYYYRDNLFSSDLTFCENAKKAGFDINVDTSLKVGHIGEEKVINEEYYLKHLSPESKKEWNENMKFNLRKVREKENSPRE